MSDAIQVTATFPAIDEGDLEPFKQAVREAVAAAREEQGTLQYDWFFTEDESACRVRERFESSEAFLDHGKNVGATLERLVELGGGLRLEFFGQPTEELIEAMAGVELTVYPFFEGK
jgi:quinol monooxygenase YgiN